MITQKQIAEFGKQIGGEFHPQKVVLFGSYAYGTPNLDSDVDILVNLRIVTWVCKPEIMLVLFVRLRVNLLVYEIRLFCHQLF